MLENRGVMSYGPILKDVPQPCHIFGVSLTPCWDMATLASPGVVKSYNDRRGFGFLACTETADCFGRDVYMPKAGHELCICANYRDLSRGHPKR